MTTEDYIVKYVLGASGGTVNGQSVYFIPCPGASSHTSPSHPNDCYLGITSYAERWMYIKCFHSSCHYARKSYIKKLNREYIQGTPSSPAKKTFSPRPPKVVDIEKYKQIYQAHQIRETVQPIPPPNPVFTEPKEDMEYFYTLWQPQDLIWVGQPTDSVPAAFSRINDRPSPMNFTCGSTFQHPGSRSKKNICDPKYIVLECDSDPKPVQWGLLTYLDQQVQPLVMCVDSGGKSLHGWFERTQWMRDHMEHFLPTLGFDHATMGISQPCRCPGAYREEKDTYQRIIYVKK